MENRSTIRSNKILLHDNVSVDWKKLRLIIFFKKLHSGEIVALVVNMLMQGHKSLSSSLHNFLDSNFSVAIHFTQLI